MVRWLCCLFCCSMVLRVRVWLFYVWCFFFFKQKTAYEMRISDWSSDVCSSDLDGGHEHPLKTVGESLGWRFLRLRFAHHFDHLGQRRIGGKASDGDFDRSRTVDGAGEYAMLSGTLVRLGCRLGSVRHRLLIDGDAFACHGGLVDARSPDHAEPVCCQQIGRASCRERVCQYG